MKKLLSFLKDYRRESVLGPLFKLIEASFELMVPLAVASIIDNGITAGDSKHIVFMTLLLAGLGVAGLIASLTAQYFAAKASVGFATKARHALFEHIQSFSYTVLDKLGAPTLITRMTSDMNQIQAGLNLTLRLLLRSPFVVFGAMIMAFMIDPKTALVFVGAIPILSAVVIGIMLLTIPLYRRVQEKLDTILGLTRENISGARVIRAFGAEERECENFGHSNQELTLMQRLVSRISSLMNPVTYVIINIAIILLIYSGALRVYDGILSQGQVVAMYNYISQILVELIKLANLIINITKSIACGKRVCAVLEMPSGEENVENVSDISKTDFPASSVEFQNVSLKYSAAGDESLSNISFSAKAGDIIGIIGGTGSGKTSLVNLIPRFYEASSGKILIDGTNVKDIPAGTLRETVGIVPQQAAVFKGTVRENMLWGSPNASDKEISEALERAQVKETIFSKKGALDAEIEEGGKNFSGGQRQRLTVARALIKKPRILILDDSSSALDFATDAAMRKAIAETIPRPTTFIVSQRTSSIAHADMIIVLDEGKAVGIGTHNELLESCEVYREIYTSQHKNEAVTA